MIFVGSVSAQSSVVIPVDIELQDLKEVDHRLQELELLRQKSKEQEKTIAELENSLAIEKRTNELNERELYLQKKISEVKDMEIQALNRNFDQMKEVADRSLKLVETAKPKFEWYYIIPIVGLIGYILGGL
jgi:uncharacterized coiled-coil protein SlyX